MQGSCISGVDVGSATIKLGDEGFYNLIIGIIGALQTFSTALVMTDGGPVNSTTFYVLTLYRRAFEDMRMGYASAMAWVLMVVTLLLTLVVFWIGNKKVYYEQ